MIELKTLPALQDDSPDENTVKTQIDYRPVITANTTSPDIAPPDDTRQLLAQHGLHLDTDLPWDVIGEAQKRVAVEMAQMLSAAEGPITEERLRVQARPLAMATLQPLLAEARAAGRYTHTQETTSRCEDAVLDSIYGFGRLQKLLDCPEIENIWVFGSKRTRVEFANGRFAENLPPVAETEQGVQQLVRDVVSKTARLYNDQNAERPFSLSTPIVDMRLPGGHRMSATMSVSSMTQITIRRHRLQRPTLEGYVSGGVMSREAARFLDAAVKAGINIVVAGDQGSGKTTLLRTLALSWDPAALVVTLESDRELGLDEIRPNTISFESTAGNYERRNDGSTAGALSLSDLFPTTLRQSADHLIVGEVRGSEAKTILPGLVSFTGSMLTTHGSSARAAFERLVIAACGETNMSDERASKFLAGSIGLIVHLKAIREGGRKRRTLDEIVAVSAGEGTSGASFTTVFEAPTATALASPAHWPAHLEDKLHEVGYTQKQFTGAP